MTKIPMPELGEEIEKAVVSHWYFKPGNKVNRDDDIVELTTDKATFNLPSPASCVLKEIVIVEGNEVKVGQTLAVIE